ELDGIVDIYLPDIKYADDEWSVKLSNAPNYVKTARAAIKEMFRQVGQLIVDDDNIAIHGLIVRHLILPGNLAGSHASLNWLAQQISPDVAISVMAQYYPSHLALNFPELARSITTAEYRAVVNSMEILGMENGWLQDVDSNNNYLPDFTREGHPFEPD